MNICVVNIRENNPFIGGVERVTYALCEEWIKMGHKVICCSTYNSRTKIEYSKVFPEYFLPNNECVNTSENVDFLLSLIDTYKIDVVLNQAFPWKEIDDFCYQIKCKSHIRLFTAIHYAPYQAYIGAKNNLFIRRNEKDHGIKWFFHQLLMLISFYLYRGWILKRNEKKLVRLVSNQSDVVVALSKSYASSYSKMSHTSNFISIENPLYEDVSFDLDVKLNQVIYVGRLEYGLKRFDRVLKIWSEIEPNFPSWNLVVLGSGNYMSAFMKKAKVLNLKRITFKGFQNPDKYIRQSKILLLTSSSEGLPMVILEAKQRACVPILFNSFGAASELVKDGEDGFLIKKFCISDYVQKLSVLMSNEKLLCDMSYNAKHSLGERYRIDRIAQLWIDYFNKTR